MTDGITHQQVRDYVSTFPHFRRPEEQGYLATAVDRFTRTLNLIPKLPEPERVRVLEIGGRPYFMSALVEHFFGYEVHLANEPTPFPGEEGKHIELAHDSGGVLRFPCERLNIEYDDWPWADGFFDVVLYCEVIEHLVYDPTHTLVEAHRVLKRDTGTLVISTPNALCYTHMIDMVRGRNPYPPYDGYSHYARHHRLFSPAELQHLCSKVGYSVQECYSAYDPAYAHPRKVDRLVRWLVRRGRLTDRLDVIYLVATPSGDRRYAYPATRPYPIYADVHAYGHIVSNVLRMTDDLPQFGGGFHPVEDWGGGVRWTAPQARFFLKREDESELVLTFLTGRPTDMEVRGWVEVETDEASERYPLSATGEGLQTLRFPLPAGKGQVAVLLNIDEPLCPAEVTPGSRDQRRLGIAMREAALV